jgi:(1->4)-alpha-D-glucan 1-alpha-D-glucosylmutase
VPDIYQGCEQWNFSLVDPDNRRPVDFESLAVQLEGLRDLYEGGWPTDADWRELNRQIGDGRLKQLVTWRLLQLRAAHPDLFRDGAYLPLAVGGDAAEHAVAYARHREGHVVLVIGARLTYTLCQGDSGRWGSAVWRNTHLSLETEHAPLNRGSRWRDWVTGREFEVARSAGASLALAEVFDGAGALPFAVLVSAEGGPE